jgi:hypothetical protein
MMIILEIVLLILGLIISIITLVRNDIKKNPLLKKGLSSLYILLCVVSIIILITKNSNDIKNNIKLFETLGEIETLVDIQSDSIRLVLEKTSRLNEKLDSINNKTEEAIIQREQSQKIFTEQNRILKKANELTQKQLIEESPFVEIFTNSVIFELTDSIKTQFNLTFANTKNRIANKFQHSELIVFKDKQKNQYYSHLLLPTDGINRMIQKNHPVSAKKTLNINYDDFLKIADESVLLTSIKFYDELLGENKYYELIFEIEVKEGNVVVNLEKPNFKKDVQNYMNINKLSLK